MTRIQCEQCGARLRLSIADASYVCTSDPAHVYPRLDAERRWIDVHRALAEADPSDAEAALALAAAYGSIGAMAFVAGDADRAQTLFKDELAILEALHAAHVEDDRVSWALLESLAGQAQIAEESDQRATSLSVLQRMLPLAQALHEAHADDDERARALSACLNGLGRMHRSLRDEAAAAIHFAKDIEVLTALCARHAGDVELSTDLAVAHFNKYLVSSERAAERAHLEETIRLVDATEAGAGMSELGAAVRDRARAVLATMPALEMRDRGELDKDDANHETPEQLHAWLVGQVDAELARRRS